MCEDTSLCEKDQKACTLDKTTTTYELVPRDAKFDYTGFWIVGVKRFETEVKAVVVLWTVPTGSRVAASGRQQRADEAFAIWRSNEELAAAWLAENENFYHPITLIPLQRIVALE